MNLGTAYFILSALSDLVVSSHPMKANESTKNNELDSFQRRSLNLALVCLLLVFTGLGFVGFRTNYDQYTAGLAPTSTTIAFPVIEQVAIGDGMANDGLGWWWVVDKSSSFILRNDNSGPRVFELSLKVGPSPCQDQVSLTFRIRNVLKEVVLTREVPHIKLPMKILLNGSSFLKIPIEISSSGCTVDNDPRTFFASIQVTVLTDRAS